MDTLLQGVIPYKKEDAALYDRMRWWYGLTLGDLLDRASDIHPSKEAFVDGQSRLTYAEARAGADKLAVALLEMGIHPLDRVLVQLPNWNEFIYSYFALQKIGAIPVLLIDRYRQLEIGRLVELTGATGWIVAFCHRKTDFVPIVDEVLQAHSGLKHVITVRDVNKQGPFLRMEELMANPVLGPVEKEHLLDLRPDPMQVAHMGPTGGTTGSPKIVPRTHNSLVTCADFCARSWDQHTLDINLIAGPIGHDLSFTKGFLGSIATIGKTIFLDSTDASDICQTIEKEKVTSIIWVPALAQRLLGYEKLKYHDLSSLKKMHSAGAASHPDIVASVFDTLGMTFFNGYGATEGMTTITRSTDDIDTICTTVGRPTCPYDDYRVIDFHEKPLPTGVEGELVLKGPGVFTGYYKTPEENKAAFTLDGYFKTGDVGKFDENGYITLTGRIKEMINRGGESISTRQIEELITKHPDVAAVAVVPMPDPVLGERACAYIELRKGAALTFIDIVNFLKSQQASVLLLPERIEFLDAMPYTAAQKLDKKALRKDIEAKINRKPRRKP